MKSIWFWLFLIALISAGPANAVEMALIPEGLFQMGWGERDEHPVHTVYVASFYMDRHLVTNADYARFLNGFGNREGGGKKWLDNVGPLSSWLCKIRQQNGRFEAKPGYENHPVIKVSWYGAERMRFGWESDCLRRLSGKRRPEAEWRAKSMSMETLSALLRRMLGVFMRISPSVLTLPMGLDCTTWWPVSGSGVMTGTIRIIMPDHPPGIRKGQERFIKSPTWWFLVS